VDILYSTCPKIRAGDINGDRRKVYSRFRVVAYWRNIHTVRRPTCSSNWRSYRDILSRTWDTNSWVGTYLRILVLVGAVMLYVNPEKSKTWGVIVLVFSIISLFFALGGFIVGMILGIIGGALGIAWKPSPPLAPAVTPAAAQPITRVCPQCGRVLKEDVKFCPHCGKALE